ncbi:hypothetical protein E3N88_04317 [Mikania micrantha]|uniref:Uncharacterized protein n=1 Tax=Mikania micrantha TaxID=192012 RepID=A0A5N6PU24_9ASTR|nr:hypothetical protein E3N88_04317 [Mikania micrantha]
MKLGLLGSSGAHRGTRWPIRGPIAVRDEIRENLNPEFLRGMRSIFLPLSAVAGDQLHYLTLQELTLTLVRFTKVIYRHKDSGNAPKDLSLGSAYIYVVSF